MQENSFQITGFKNGLVPHPHYPAGADYASTLTNLRPVEYGAAAPEWFTCPFAFTLDWPFPQLHRGENVTLLLKRASVSTLNSAWSESAITVKQADNRGSNATISGGGVWHTATFEDNWFATNGTDLIYKIASHAETVKPTGLTVSTLCAHDDRLIMAGLAGDWFSGSRWLELFRAWREKQPRFSHDQMAWSDRWVIWSDRNGGDFDVPFYPLLTMLGCYGNTAFDALKSSFLDRIEDGEIGFSSVRRLGVPEASAALGNDVVLYSKEARIILSPGSGVPGYAVIPTEDPGVANRGGLSASRGRHVWMTPSRDLNSQVSGGPVEDLRQAHRLTGSLTNLVTAYDTEANEHRFSTENWSYLVNRYGVGGSFTVRPTSLARVDGVLYGVASNLADTTVPVELYSHTVDMGYRGSKRVQMIECYDELITVGTVDVKASTYNETPTSLGAVPTNEYGVGTVLRAGNEFQIGRKGTGSVGTDYSVQKLTVRYQSEDRRFRRGTGGGAPDS